MGKRFTLGTAGHIDHGKTSLVRALTGVDADRLPEEKERGLTIDLGFAELKLADCTLDVVDVPGHERFIKNMLAGAAAVDLALLVVAADDSIMPQTHEHLAILELLRVAGGVVALTKCDLRDREWLDLVKEEIAERLADGPLASAPVVMTAVPPQREPLGVDELRAALNQAALALNRRDDGPFRLCVDRVFSVSGRGTVVTGTVASGSLTVNDDVELLPRRRGLKVRGLQSHGKSVEQIARGSRAAINLAGIDRRDIQRGDVLATPGYLRPSQVVFAELRVLENSDWPIKHRGRYTLHIGSQAVPSNVYLLRGASLAPGESATAQIHATRPVAVVFDQPFVLRNESPVATVGGGTILQPCPRVVRRSRMQEVERIGALPACDARRRVELAIREYGAHRWSRLDLGRDTGVWRDHAASCVSTLEQEGRLVRLAGDALIHVDVTAGIKRRVLNAVDALHRERPLQLWIPRGHVADRLQGQIPEALLEAVFEMLVVEGILESNNQRLKLVEFAPQPTQRQSRDLEQLRAALQVGGLEPPTVAELAAQLGRKSSEVVALLQLLVDLGKAEFVSPQLFLDTNCASRVRQYVGKALSDQEQMTVAEIRDLLGVSRKYAVPICEYLDRCGVTVRCGDHRRLGPAAERRE